MKRTLREGGKEGKRGGPRTFFFSLFAFLFPPLYPYIRTNHTRTHSHRGNTSQSQLKTYIHAKEGIGTRSPFTKPSQDTRSNQYNKSHGVMGQPHSSVHAIRTPLRHKLRPRITCSSPAIRPATSRPAIIRALARRR